MNNRFRKVLAITKINLKQSKFTYIFTLSMLLLGIAGLIVNNALNKEGTGHTLDLGCYLYFAVIFAPIMIPARNFQRIMHLNGKKTDYYWGTLINYVILSAVISLLSLLLLYVTDAVSLTSSLSVIRAFGWLQNGVIIAFFQQFAFLFFAAVFIHTLTTLQTSWVGWAADVLLVLIISIFLPIAPLREAIGQFFYIIIFQESVILQIAACLGLVTVLYALDLLALRRQKI